MMLDLEEDVQALFDEAQAGQETVFDRAHGFHIEIRGQSGKTAHTPARAAYSRAYQALKHREDIRARLLAGERPVIGKRGRPPTAWFEVAASLGLDIGAAPVAPTAKERMGKRHDAKVRARIIAGERPSFKGPPPSRWLRIAAELGVDLKVAA